MPEINAIDMILIDIYNASSNARDGMTGGLNYGVLLQVAKAKGLREFDDLLYLTDEIERNLNKKRTKDKK